MTIDDRVVARLDRIVSILQLAHYDAIERARALIRADPVNAALLDLAQDWIRAGELHKQVVTDTGAKIRTVQRRAAALVGQGALAQRGAGANVEYRSTGLL